MSKVRAKFVCTGVVEYPDNEQKSVTFSPVIDGSEENKSFSKYTPGGQIQLSISYETEASNAFEVHKMSQSKKHSALESIVNVVLGLLISFLIQIVIYPVLGIPVTLNQNIIITIVFFIASFLRSYLIRRFFNNKSK